MTHPTRVEYNLLYYWKSKLDLRTDAMKRDPRYTVSGSYLFLVLGFMFPQLRSVILRYTQVTMRINTVHIERLHCRMYSFGPWEHKVKTQSNHMSRYRDVRGPKLRQPCWQAHAAFIRDAGDPWTCVMFVGGDGNTTLEAAHGIPQRCVRSNVEDLGGCTDRSSSVAGLAIGKAGEIRLVAPFCWRWGGRAIWFSRIMTLILGGRSGASQRRWNRRICGICACDGVVGIREMEIVQGVRHRFCSTSVGHN